MKTGILPDDIVIFAGMSQKPKLSEIWRGILFVAAFSAGCMFLSEWSVIKSTGISPLILGILLGMVIGNTVRKFIPEDFFAGIRFSTKQILRTAVVFYGFRITFTEIADVGLQGIFVSVLMVTCTFLLGTWAGKKFFGLDQETAILTSSGSSICGAAAVLATESVLKSDPSKSAMAVATVVLFGTVSMFLFPLIYTTGITGLTASNFGLYIGGSVHEVAQVVAAGNAVGEIASDNAVIVKMTRVMLIAPLLLSLGYFLKKKPAGPSGKMTVPWFVFLFIGVAAFNSFDFLEESVVDKINYADTFLLTVAMTALGIETNFSKFKNIGAGPVYLAGMLFLWLVAGGFLITKLALILF